MNRYFSYEYFCSANVTVEIEGFPLLEVAGLSLSMAESKIPLYGYSSRFFDAVARGQVIVQGAIALNYVHQDYLTTAIEFGLNNLEALDNDKYLTVAKRFSRDLKDQISSSQSSRDKFAKQIASDYRSNLVLAETLKNTFWDTQDLLPQVTRSKRGNPHDRFGGLDIVVNFGERDYDTNTFGTTAFRIKNVYFTGRSLPISLGENVIIEEHSFFARNIELFEPTSIITKRETLPTDSTVEIETTYETVQK